MRLFTATFLCLACLTARAANTHVSLILANPAPKPGDTVLIGVRLQIDPDWHIYWSNPGDSGTPTKIAWELPPGITAGDIQWPLPEKATEGEPPTVFTTYVYVKEVVLVVPLKLAADVATSPLEIKANVSWLECKTQCIPGKQSATITIHPGGNETPSPEASLIADWQSKVPRENAKLNPRAHWEASTNAESRTLILEWDMPVTGDHPDFFPDAYEKFEIGNLTDDLHATPPKVTLRKQVKKFEGDWPTEVAGVSVLKTGSGETGYLFKSKIADGPAQPPGKAATPLKLSTPATSFWTMLFYAFLGGLILNGMPCVLPVIALKILGFVNEAQSHPSRVRNLGLVYALGVLASFGALAGLVIGVKAAGHAAGWGMQFSDPKFIVVLSLLVTLVALNLFGVFEVTLSGRVMNTADTLSRGSGAGGAFFNGVLATILATPCSAAFLGTALGYAFTQSSAVILLMLLMVGVGLAFPYVVLSWHPAWLKFLPKPGAWMEKFKIAMGFPMLATVFWLLNLSPIHYGTRSWWLGMFLVIVALAAWIYGEFVQRGRSRRGLAVAICLTLLVGGYVWALEGNLQWRNPESEAPASLARNDPGGLDWQPWSPEAVAAAQKEGRPVVIDFTAQWCATCNAIVKPAIESNSVREKLKTMNAVTLLADYTKTPENITRELQRFGRAAVPLVVIHPANPQTAAVVLPEPSLLMLPSQYARIILDGLNQAAR